MIKEKITRWLRLQIPAAITFAVTFAALRIYEYAEVKSSTENASLVFSGLPYDIAFALSLCVTVIVLSSLLFVWKETVGKIATLVVYSIFLFMSFLLTRYFTITLIPLGPDLFGYSLSDIQTTVESSGSADVAAVFCLLLFISFFILTSIGLMRRFRDKITFVCLTPFFTFLLSSFFFPHFPAETSQRADHEYNLVVNKTAYFLTRSSQYLTASAEPLKIQRDYPFIHPVNYQSQISKFIQPTPSYPNLVFILVEGLGRDFVGDGAKYGGFTDFLDSLSEKSLYWENGLSNAGRTFGVLPSILGALPYGKNGFLSYGAKMPDHRTLLSLLGEQGYTTNFFYGGNSSFDNMDIFLEYERTDYIMSEMNFPSVYKKMLSNAEGFSWGYADRDVFNCSLNITKKDLKQPRLDIYLTLATHEPFVAPEKKFEERFEERLSKLDWSEEKKKTYKNYKGIFSCLMYTDDSIRELINSYASREDFNRTVFIITGDHRLIPVPHDTKISRFHVPIIMYSPMIKEPKNFSSLITHSSMPATILGWLSSQYNMSFPTELPFISGAATTHENFSSDIDVALMRNKSEIIDYVENELFLSDGQLYKILPEMKLQEITDETAKKRLSEKLERFKSNGVFACENNKVDKVSARSALIALSTEDQRYLSTQKIDQLDSDQQFFKARELALNQKRRESRIVIGNLLNHLPNHIDARVLLARTFAWDSKYDTARSILEQAKQRSPNYAEIYCALSDIDFYEGNFHKSLATPDTGLKIDPTFDELRIRRARGLWLTGKESQARRITEEVLKTSPENEIAVDLKKRF